MLCKAFKFNSGFSNRIHVFGTCKDVEIILGLVYLGFG